MIQVVEQKHLEVDSTWTISIRLSHSTWTISIHLNQYNLDHD